MPSSVFFFLVDGNLFQKPFKTLPLIPNWPDGPMWSFLRLALVGDWDAYGRIGKAQRIHREGSIVENKTRFCYKGGREEG